MLEIETAGDYAMRIVLPHVQAFLYRLHEQFTCGLEWTKVTSRPYAPTQSITAAPLDVKRWSPYVRPHALGEALLGEYAWQVASDSFGVRQLGEPGRTGHVRLNANVFADIDVLKGTPEYLSKDGSMPGFLCRAERCVLEDGSVCYRLNTSVGMLWLRQATDQGLGAPFCDQDPPLRGEPIVVHLAETSCYRPRLLHYIFSGPWTNFRTRDESGRVWTIGESKLDFEAICRLRAVGCYDDRLRERPITVLHPPYDGLWQPDGYEGFGIPLDFAVSKP